MIALQAKEFYETYSAKDPWEQSAFRWVKKMENDTRGQFGERMISEALHLHSNFTFDMDYNNQNLHEDGHYDLKINGKRIEVKTSCRTVGGSWQHEPLYADDKCDIVIFVDFDYDNLHLSVLKSEDLPLGRTSEFFKNKKGCLRKNKDDGYKLDFSNKTIRDLIAFGLAKTYDATVTVEQISEFLGDRINELI